MSDFNYVKRFFKGMKWKMTFALNLGHFASKMSKALPWGTSSAFLG